MAYTNSNELFSLGNLSVAGINKDGCSYLSQGEFINSIITTFIFINLLSFL